MWAKPAVSVRASPGLGPSLAPCSIPRNPHAEDPSSKELGPGAQSVRGHLFCRAFYDAVFSTNPRFLVSGSGGESLRPLAHLWCFAHPFDLRLDIRRKQSNWTRGPEETGQQEQILLQNSSRLGLKTRLGIGVLEIFGNFATSALLTHISYVCDN